MCLTDKMPRRKVLVIGTFMCAVALATNSGLSAVLAKQTERGEIDMSYGQGALASYFLFNIIFSFTYTPLQGAIPTEALETTTRAKGLALSAFIVNGMGFINLFAGPIALERIGYKYIFVFVAWDCVEALAWYLFGYVCDSLHPFLHCYFLFGFLLTLLLSLLPVSSPRAAPSSSSNGSTTSATPSRRPRRSTRWLYRATATLQRRLPPTPRLPPLRASNFTASSFEWKLAI